MDIKSPMDVVPSKDAGDTKSGAKGGSNIPGEVRTYQDNVKTGSVNIKTPVTGTEK